MESSVGYSQGTGTKIGTHQFGTGVDAVHHQRFATGTGRAQLMQVIVPGTGTTNSDLLDCLASGRIVIAPICTVVGVIFTVHFFDADLMDMGITEEIEIDPVGTAAFAEVADNDWTVDTEYGALELIKENTSYIYQQVEQDSGEYIAGTSHATTEPTWPTTVGNTVADGTCLWACRGLFTSALNTPLVVFSNSMGATYYKIYVTTAAGTFSFWSDAI